MNYLLIGAGGHAKAIVEGIEAAGDVVEAYVDPRPVPWIAAERIADDETAGQAAPDAIGVIGIGGADSESLVGRLELLDLYLAAGRPFDPWIHPTARISASAQLGEGCVALSYAIVHPAATVEKGAIINTGAIVEHDSRIGAGSHIAPGAIVLGGCTIGRCCMIGAGAVVLPGCDVADGVTVPAASRHSTS